MTLSPNEEWSSIIWPTVTQCSMVIRSDRTCSGEYTIESIQSICDDFKSGSWGLNACEHLQREYCGEFGNWNAERLSYGVRSRKLLCESMLWSFCLNGWRIFCLPIAIGSKWTAIQKTQLVDDDSRTWRRIYEKSQRFYCTHTYISVCVLFQKDPLSFRHARITSIYSLKNIMQAFHSDIHCSWVSALNHR